MLTLSHTWAAVALTAGVVIGCQSRQETQAEPRVEEVSPVVAREVQTASSVPTTTVSAPKLEPMGAIGREELRSLLAGFADSHANKIRLSGWAGTPFLPVSAQFKPFFGEMSRANKELAAELKGLAKKRGIDLTRTLPNTVEGRATKMLEERHEKMIRGDDQANFERDILMEMFADYEWHICLIRTMLPAVTDPELKSYLQKSLNMYEKGSVEIRMLLKRYRFQ